MRSLHLPFKISILVILLILLFSSQSTFAQSGWQWQNPLPQGNDLKIVKFLNSNTGFAAGDKGTVLKTTNGGANWNFTNFNFENQTIEYLIIIDSNIVYAATGYANLYKTTNCGDSWIFVSYVAPEFNCLTFLNANTGFAVIDKDEIKKTTDGGITWILSYTLSSLICEVNFITEQIGFFTVSEHIAASNNMWRTTDQGATWAPCMTNPTNEQCRKMSFINPTTGYLVKINTTNSLASILKTTNAGINWSQISNFPGKFSYSSGFCFEMKNDGYGYIGFSQLLYRNTIYRTSNSGLSWDSTVSLPTIGYFSSYIGWFHYPIFNFITSGTGYYIANGGYILKTTDYGANWTNQTSAWGNIEALNQVTFPNATTGYIFGYGGTILKTTNTGLNWNYSKLRNYTLHSSFFLNAETGFVGSDRSTMFKTTNGGLLWDTIIVNSYFGHINSIFFLNIQTGYVTNSYYSYKTTNGGTNWQQLPLNDWKLGGMQFINEYTGFVFCSVDYSPSPSFSKIFKTTNAGMNWSQITYFTGNYMRSLKFVTNDIGFAVYDGRVIKTTNGGTNWFPVLLSSDADEVKTMGSNTVYSGSYKSTNDGANWTLFKTKIQSINSIEYINENTGFIVGGKGAAILKTTDGGEIISAINPISSNIPDGISLKQNYPNPFNPTTKINFDLKNSAFAMLRVYDITGREVRTLVNEKLTAGSYTYDFNAFELPSGVYFYQLQADGFIETKKMILLK